MEFPSLSAVVSGLELFLPLTAGASWRGRERSSRAMSRWKRERRSRGSSDSREEKLNECISLLAGRLPHLDSYEDKGRCLSAANMLMESMLYSCHSHLARRSMVHRRTFNLLQNVR